MHPALIPLLLSMLTAGISQRSLTRCDQIWITPGHWDVEIISSDGMLFVEYDRFHWPGKIYPPAIAAWWGSDFESVVLREARYAKYWERKRTFAQHGTDHNFFVQKNGKWDDPLVPTPKEYWQASVDWSLISDLLASVSIP